MIATFHLYTGTYVIAAFYYFQYNKTLCAHDIRPFPCVFPLARSLMNDAPDIKKKHQGRIHHNMSYLLLSQTHSDNEIDRKQIKPA